MAGHHGHQDDSANPGCETAQSDCGEIDDFSLDGRNHLSKLKDKAELVAIVASPVPIAALDPIGFSTTAADPPRPAGSSRRLHIINCVFLI